MKRVRDLAALLRLGRGAEAVEMGLQFEMAMAEIRMSTDLSEEDLAKLREDVMELSRESPLDPATAAQFFRDHPGEYEW